MASNSIAPSGKAIDVYLDGTDWKVDLWSEDGNTQVASTNIGTIEVDASSVIAIPLNLRKFGGDAANELRIFGAGYVMVRYAKPMNADFPVSSLTVADGEVLGQQIETIEYVEPTITRIRIAWGAEL
jgi:hypothetical protein